MAALARRRLSSLPFLRAQARLSSTLLSSSASPPPPDPHFDRSALSDHEWDLRTGRAIDLLRTTLPTFFSTGLVTHPSLSFNHSSRLDAISEDGADSIYSPRIRLSYTPPTALPAPFPRTLHIDGIPLYLASSVFIRHTLNALYTDLAVSLRSLHVNPPSPAPRTSTTSTSVTGRERSVVIGLGVTGRARVGGGQAEWVVTSTYAFHPVSALVYLHTVDSIMPAPHDAVFNLLRAALDALGGHSTPAGAAQAVTTKNETG
ncbi:hypothetical protein BV25DRAFT_1648844 [Artomyces pyxidatus]|uniref:Uncharacterized protein n=1 Tax=Artomyces pyxidatus TaxID=48021 RepID=A0ACB8SHY9_9AGAM|nr:hypothetical protein BV25DRAFT_1648844 [Artomyces pyxidatus]